MSEHSHTPGPWKIREQHYIGPERRAIWVVDSIPDVNGKLVANAICKVTASNPDELANARLIAAAPDLLAACELVIEKLDYLRNLWGDEALTKRVADAARDAVEKAKGGAE